MTEVIVPTDDPRYWLFMPVRAQWVRTITTDKISICRTRAPKTTSSSVHEYVLQPAERDVVEDDNVSLSLPFLTDFAVNLCKRHRQYKDPAHIVVTAPNSRRLFYGCIVASLLIAVRLQDAALCPHITLIDEQYSSVDATERSKGYHARAWARAQESCTPLSVLIGSMALISAVQQSLRMEVIPGDDGLYDGGHMSYDAADPPPAPKRFRRNW